MFSNPLILLLLVPAGLGWYAQRRVRSAYGRYIEQPNGSGLPGADIAERLIAHLGLSRVKIYLTPGQLNDHYDTRENALYLTEGIASSRSITAMGIVAHEVLHAAQNLEGYPLMRVRSWLGERLGHLPGVALAIVLGGLLLNSAVLLVAGAVIIVASLVLALSALPVERNASVRALVALQESGLADAGDLQGVRSVLTSAALTYLAGLLQYLGWLAFLGVPVAMASSYWRR
jgi:Zn-dependent membrane protease YugP